jgi:hypothetical protein
MKYVYEDREISMPVDFFDRPEDIVEEVICTETRMIATEYCPSRVSEVFNRKYLPGTCDQHTSTRWNEERTRRGAISY